MGYADELRQGTAPFLASKISYTGTFEDYINILYKYLMEWCKMNADNGETSFTGRTNRLTYMVYQVENDEECEVVDKYGETLDEDYLDRLKGGFEQRLITDGFSNISLQKYRGLLEIQVFWGKPREASESNIFEKIGKAIVNDVHEKANKVLGDYEHFSEYYAECSDYRLQEEINRAKNGDFNGSPGRKKALIEAGQNRGFLR